MVEMTRDRGKIFRGEKTFRNLIFFAAFCVLTALGAGCGGGKSATLPPPQPGRGDLEGTLFVDSYNARAAARIAEAVTSAPAGKTPLSGATVTLDSGSQYTTGANGYFIFEDLWPGTAVLTITHPDYATMTKTVTVVQNTVTNLNSAESADSMTMEPATSTVGTLIVSAYASATVPVPLNSAVVWINGNNTGKTTDPTAVFDNIAAATYSVTVDASGYNAPTPKEVTITAGQVTTVSFGLMPTSGNFTPAATIITPANNARYPQGMTITFTGTGVDSEDGSLTGSSLAWASDVDGALGTGTVLQKSNLTAATHTVTLTVTDSAGATGNDSVIIAVIAPTENTAPTATILTPTSGAAYTSGQTITFTGGGVDGQEGVLSGASLVWTSSLDGGLGTGNLLSLANLSVGTHTITLTATDSTGLSGTASIVVTVNTANPTNAPIAVITTPASDAEFVSGQNVVFSGSANDTEDGVLTGNSLVWTSSLDNQLGTGTVLIKSNLSIGTHTITLTATDSHGNADTESVIITIKQASGNTAPIATIVTPPDGTTFSAALYILFTGAGTDVEDGAVTGANLVWTSDVDGALGTGASLLKAKSDLTAGTHTITLTATDSGGLSGAATVTITVQ